MPVPRLEDYKDKYNHARFERRDGILVVQLHTDGKELRWGYEPHAELGYLFADIGNDPENRVIILTGTGDTFIDNEDFAGGKVTSEMWTVIHQDGRRLLANLLDIEVPMIAALNGPATIHAELGVLCDIVLAAEHTVIADKVHYLNGIVPGDGVHIVWPMLLGPNRGRYFLWTGERISAEEAKRLNIVAEVLPADRLLDRAWELARFIAERPPVTNRYTRVALVQELKRQLTSQLGYGLALEGLGAIAYLPESFVSE